MSSVSPVPGAAEHVFPVRVYYEDTDSGGVVYHSNYLRFAERARTELLRAHGIEHEALRANEGVMFAVRRCEIDYVRPARLDDRLEIATRLIELTGASFWVEQVVRRGSEILAQLKLRLVCVRQDGKPARIPAVLRSIADPLPQK